MTEKKSAAYVSIFQADTQLLTLSLLNLTVLNINILIRIIIIIMFGSIAAEAGMITGAK